MFERRGALAGVLAKGGREGSDGRRQLRIGETSGWSLSQVAAFATTQCELGLALRPLLNADLPQRVGEAVTVDGRCLLKTGTRQYWLLMPDRDDRSASLNAAVASGVGAVTSLSHSRTCVFLEGSAARELLARGIALDLHPDVFGVGRFALTALHHTPILLHRSGENRYELCLMNTFARSIWDWLTDAALPLGYDVGGDDSAPHTVLYR